MLEEVTSDLTNMEQWYPFTFSLSQDEESEAAVGTDSPTLHHQDWRNVAWFILKLTDGRVRMWH